ncbi:MAG: RNA-binding domain-containing protein [Promethearchaeota archaeon]
MDILVRCPIHPTEDTTKVEKALVNILGPQNTVRENSELMFTHTQKESLSLVRQAIHELRIIDAARKRLLSNWNGTSTQIHFDKQAAFIRKLRIIDDSEALPPLGTIEIDLIFNNETEFSQFLHWFTPPTKDGRILI